jgi:hypothetical protein
MMLERTLVWLGIVGVIASLAQPASPLRETIGFAYALQTLRWHWRRRSLAGALAERR